MKAIVTGATGFVGTWLVKELLAQGDEVTVIVRDKEKVPDEWRNKVEVIEAALEKISDLEKEDFNNKRADIFFHFAWAGMSRTGRADIELQLKNVKGTYEAVKLAERLQCKRFVNAGSIMEYEAIQYLSSDEAIQGMGNIYSSAKIMADYTAKTVAAQISMEYVNVIISNIYGEGEVSERFLYSTLRKMLRGEEIKMTHGNQLYDFIYISDAVKAIVLAAKECDSYSNCYIGNSNQRPLREYVLEMKEVLDSKSRIIFGAVQGAGTMLSYQEFDTYKLEKLGYKTEVPFADGVRKTRDWILKELEKAAYVEL